MSTTREHTYKKPAALGGAALGHSTSTRPSTGLRSWIVAHHGLVRAGGRTLLVWLSSFVVLASDRHSIPAAAALAALASLVWLWTCQEMLGAARVKRVAFGVAATTLAGIALGYVVLAAASLAVPPLGLKPLSLALMAMLAFAFVTMWESLLDRSGSARSRMLIVGADPLGVELLEAIAAVPNSNFDVIGVVDDDREADQIAGVPMYGKIAALSDVVWRERPDLVVVAVSRDRPEVFAHLLEVADANFSVIGLPEFYEQAFGRLPVRDLTPAWFMSVLHLYQRPYTRAVKRTFDLALATFGLIVLAPLFPLIGLLVRLTPGPAIYRQTRLGQSGRPFTIYKFRTMGVDAEAAGHSWAVERDPRVTRVGRLLRKTRLDEIPQLWNVVKGDMSIVGPRPERPEYLESLSAAVPYWTSRHLLKPGITGWAQVSAGYAADFESTEQKLSYDLWYLRHQSLAIDLLVCAKTISKLASGSSGW